MPFCLFSTTCFPIDLEIRTAQISSDHFPLKVKVLAAQSCLNLCNPMDYSPSGSSVHATLQAKILEWEVILFSRGSNPGLRHCRQILDHVSHQDVNSWSRIENIVLNTEPDICFSLFTPRHFQSCIHPCVFSLTGEATIGQNLHKLWNDSRYATTYLLSCGYYLA